MRWNDLAKPRRTDLGKASAQTLIANMREDLTNLETVFDGETDPKNGITFCSDLKNHSMALRRRVAIIMEQGNQPFGSVPESSILIGHNEAGEKIMLAKLTDDSKKREGRFSSVVDTHGKMFVVSTTTITAKEAETAMADYMVKVDIKNGKDVRIAFAAN